MVKKINWNSVLAMVSIFIFLISSIAMIVNAQADIENNKEAIKKNNVYQNDIQDVVIDNKDRLSKIETHYIHIKEQLDRIEDKLE